MSLQLEIRSDTPMNIPFKLRPYIADDENWQRIQTGDPMLDEQYLLQGNAVEFLAGMKGRHRGFLLDGEVTLTQKSLVVTIPRDASQPLDVRDLSRDQIRKKADRAMRFLNTCMDQTPALPRLADMVRRDAMKGVRQRCLAAIVDHFEPGQVAQLGFDEDLQGDPPVLENPELALLQMYAGRPIAPPFLDLLVAKVEGDAIDLFLTVAATLPEPLRTHTLLQAVTREGMTEGALHLLNSSDDALAVPHLIALSTQSRFRTPILAHIGRRDDARVVGFLLDVLAEGSRADCLQAAQRLGDLGDFSTIEPLAKLRNASRFGLRKELDAAIKKIQARDGSGEGGWVSLHAPGNQLGQLSEVQGGDLQLVHENHENTRNT
ncbi:hypothetical protein [Sulfidibacter corallicola]|uniref:HEAT repeat domain-containing protein n=1 Tax=Sulfidibacter corallicola TaxID=2818388 RepID=A0A8A4THX5_SULCO|nr:hypothetical protein [Sulfidibacter corallicola]QTD48368.1 hypothetical protein J3U87_22540 [Sulfidibacter corallicola]